MRSFFAAEALRGPAMVTGPMVWGVSPELAGTGLGALTYAIRHVGRVGRPVGDCLDPGGAQHGRRMQSHELLKEVLKKTSAKQISADMGLSLSLIYKWAEPPTEETGSGANNPLG